MRLVGETCGKHCRLEVAALLFKTHPFDAFRHVFQDPTFGFLLTVVSYGLSDLFAEGLYLLSVLEGKGDPFAL